MSQHRSKRRGLAGVVVLVVVALLALVGCAGGTSATASGNTLSGAQATFTGTTLDGATFDSASLKGKPQVLWFWAPWCTVCRAEAPDVAKVAAAFDGRVSFVGVPGRGKVAEMRTFVSETGTAGFRHVSDESGDLWNQFGVVSQPSFVFIDAAGHATRVTGSLDAEELRTRVQSLLAS